MMQRPVPDPKQIDVYCVGLLRPQTRRCGENVIGHGPAPGLDIDGDVLSMVVGFHLRLDVPLVYLPAEPGSFLLECKIDFVQKLDII